MADAKRQRVTGLYVNTTDKGIQYMSGKTQDGKKYQVWPNSYKEEGDNQPPFVLSVQDVEAQGQPQAQSFDMNPTPQQQPSSFKNDDSF